MSGERLVERVTALRPEMNVLFGSHRPHAYNEPMTSGSRPADDEEIGRLAEEVRAAPGGFLSYSMKLLRIRAGFERLREERVVPSIEAGLLAHGLGTLPSTLPPTENPMIWIYLLDGDIERLVDAARAEGRALT